LCDGYTFLYFLSVASCGRAAKASELSREDKDRLDPVISDVDMPDKDGFKLLERVGLEMDLPVIGCTWRQSTAGCLKDMFRVEEARTTTLYIGMYVFQA